MCWVVIGNRWPHNPALPEGLEDLIELSICVVFILFSVIFCVEGKNHLCVHIYGEYMEFVCDFYHSFECPLVMLCFSWCG